MTAGRGIPGLSVPPGSVRIMDGKELFARVRDDLPGLRQLPAGPLPVTQPSRVDEIRAARFDAYLSLIHI